ncbi:MAG: Asp-tRNA(Asn)/Glu-tRNA(Gln) amidotransferase subunit GatA [Methylacidiphilales bacterium]|nr:Asp-tRNA(Asn)/Glu-tRNA(Gln) amidotransferase subunit GatA [Candidatus Methylacidiphilales bacterium]
MNSPLHTLSITALATLLNEKKISSYELCEHLLKRIEQFESSENKLNCFISLQKEKALACATKIDNQRSNGTHQKYSGIPIAHKDIFCTSGVPTTCGSKMLQNFTPPYSATVVERLENQGIISIGKCNMDEFAMGSSNETSAFGSVHNPWDRTKVPGGSSGGSAASVSACYVPATTATDTGGSIRQPAALCGVTGIKPSYGRVSRFGQIAFASSLDQAGIIARTAEDCAILLSMIAGKDSQDHTTSSATVPIFEQSLDQPLQGKKIGVVRSYINQLPNNLAIPIEVALKQFELLGATLVDVDLSNHHLAISVYQIIASAECSSNLSRYDGIRFGHRTEQASTFEELIVNSRSEGFGIEVKRRILLGTFVLSSECFDAYYLTAKQLQENIRQDYNRVFAEVDLIIAPTSPCLPFSLGEKVKSPMDMYLADAFTVSVNLAELPAMSIPVGQSNNLPVGLQLIAPMFQEAMLLAFAHQFQQHTEHHTVIPTPYL